MSHCDCLYCRNNHEWSKLATTVFADHQPVVLGDHEFPLPPHTKHRIAFVCKCESVRVVCQCGCGKHTMMSVYYVTGFSLGGRQPLTAKEAYDARERDEPCSFEELDDDTQCYCMYCINNCQVADFHEPVVLGEYPFAVPPHTAHRHNLATRLHTIEVRCQCGCGKQRSTDIHVHLDRNTDGHPFTTQQEYFIRELADPAELPENDYNWREDPERCAQLEVTMPSATKRVKCQ